MNDIGSIPEAEISCRHDWEREKYIEVYYMKHKWLKCSKCDEEIMGDWLTDEERHELYIEFNVAARNEDARNKRAIERYTYP